MSAPCRRVGCQWREERTGRNVAFLSEMNYRCVFDSWCWLCGKYRLCQVNFEKASIFGQRQSAWPFRNNPSFHSFTSCFALFFFAFLSIFSFFLLSFFHSIPPSLPAFSPVPVRRSQHARPWQHRLLMETAIVYQHLPLMRQPSCFGWNICTNLLVATSIRRRPLLENKYASIVDTQLYSPACVLH